MVSDDIKYLANKAYSVYISSDKIVDLGQKGNFDTHRDLLGIERVLKVDKNFNFTLSSCLRNYEK